MKQIIILAICAFAGTPLFSQATITTGKPYPDLGASGSYFKKGNSIVAVKWSDNKPVLHRLNASTLTQERALRYDDFPKGYELERIAKIGEHPYFIYSVKERGIRSIFARKIDVATGEFVDSGKKLADIQDEVADDIGGSFSMLSNDFYFEHGRYKIYFSADTSRFAICYRIKSNTLNSSESFEENGVWIFDNALNEQWHGIVRMPYSEEKIDIRARAIDSRGNVHFFISKYNDNTTIRKRDGLPNYSLEVLSYSPASGQFTVTPIDFNNKFFHSVKFIEFKGKMICSGYYNNDRAKLLLTSKNGGPDVAGVFTLTLNGDGTHGPLVMHEIPIEVINEGESKAVQERNLKKQKKEPLEFPFLSLQGLVVAEDESLLIAGESQYYISGQHGISSFNYGDALFVKILPDGSLDWIKKIRKLSFFSVFRSRSYTCLPGNDGKYNFIYIDAKANFDAKPGDDIKGYSDSRSGNGMLTLWRLDRETGEIEKKALVDMKNANGLHLYEFSTERVVPFNSTSFIFEAQLRTMERFSTTGQEIKQGVLVKVEIKE